MDDQTQTRVTALVQRGRSVKSEITSLNEELKEIEAKISDLAPIGWKAVIDGVEASRRDSNRQFDWRGYYDSLTPNDKMDCLRTGFNLVDEKLVAKHAESKGEKERFMMPPKENKGVLKLMP